MILRGIVATALQSKIFVMLETILHEIQDRLGFYKAFKTYLDIFQEANIFFIF